MEHYKKNRLIDSEVLEAFNKLTQEHTIEVDNAAPIDEDDPEANAVREGQYSHLSTGGSIRYTDEQIAMVEHNVDEKFVIGVQTCVRYRYCQKCSQIKPPRAHHCSICNRCVMRMDHHCPWVGNCVGFRTHRYFWNFLLYALLGAANVAISMISYKGLAGMQDEIFYMMAAIISLAFSVAISFMLGIHTYMLLSNMTTLEMGALSLRNPFDQGSKVKNWEQTFGTNKLGWFFPLSSQEDE